jgi:hypothetical protein
MGLVRARPTSPERLVAEVVDLIVRRGEPSGRDESGVRTVRVGIDGAQAAGPGELADRLVDPLRSRGRGVMRVRASDFLRPASLRLERGRTDPASFYEDWLDTDALRREVLDPVGPGGSGRIRTMHWNVDTDRASRAGYADVAPGTVIVLSGALLLGHGLGLDVTVHLELSSAALARRTPPELAWTLPAYDRYAAEVSPASWADVVVRMDDPRRPAVVVADSAGW